MRHPRTVRIWSACCMAQSVLSAERVWPCSHNMQSVDFCSLKSSITSVLKWKSKGEFCQFHRVCLFGLKSPWKLTSKCLRQDSHSTTLLHRVVMFYKNHRMNLQEKPVCREQHLPIWWVFCCIELPLLVFFRAATTLGMRCWCWISSELFWLSQACHWDCITVFPRVPCECDSPKNVPRKREVSEVSKNGSGESGSEKEGLRDPRVKVTIWGISHQLSLLFFKLGVCARMDVSWLFRRW